MAFFSLPFPRGLLILSRSSLSGLPEWIKLNLYYSGSFGPFSLFLLDSAVCSAVVCLYMGHTHPHPILFEIQWAGGFLFLHLFLLLATLQVIEASYPSFLYLFSIA